MLRLAPLLALLASIPAAAQDGGVFALDPVYVSRFMADNPQLQPVANHLRTVAEQRLGDQFLVVARTEVPPFPEYSAEIYLQNCPSTEYVGCGFVIGERAQAEYVVTALVHPPSEDGAPPLITTAFMDVADSRVVFTFDAAVAREDEPKWADGVAQLLDRIIAGKLSDEDLREEDPAAKARRIKEERLALADQLGEMDAELGAVVRPSATIGKPKITEEDTAAIRDQEEAKPWERVDMGESEYIRYTNSGWTLSKWRHEARGRAGRVIVSAGVGLDRGPYGQIFEGFRGLDGATLAPTQVDEYQELHNSGGLLTNLELRVGVHKWVDVGLYAAGVSSHYQFRFAQKVDGQELFPPEFNDKRITRWQLGARAFFAPFATLPVHPVGIIGFGTWKGTSIDRVSELPTAIEPLPAQNLVLIEAGGGVEVEVSDLVTIFGRGLAEIPIAGNTVAEYETGSDIMTPEERPAPPGEWGAGLHVLFGVAVHIPLWGGSDDSTPPPSSDEPDELEELD